MRRLGGETRRITQEASMQQVGLNANEVARMDARLASVLPAGVLYAVGGRVRDELRAALDGIVIPIKDLDYVVVGMELDDILVRLRSIGRAELAGTSFAVVKMTIDDVTADIALPRRERSIGVGHGASGFSNEHDGAQN
jgi:tRNA nucleotidyltransferase/poly(A) polymerase